MFPKLFRSPEARGSPYIFLLLPAALFLFYFLLWTWGPPLLTTTVEALGSFLLRAEVSLESVRLSSTSLRLQGISIQPVSPSALQSFSAAELLVRFDPLELLQGKLRTVVLRSPRLTLRQTAPSSSSGFSLAGWSKVPLTGTVQIEGGEVVLVRADQRFTLQELMATLTLSADHQRIAFSLQGRVVPQGLSLSTSGQLVMNASTPWATFTLSLPSFPLPWLVQLSPPGLLPAGIGIEGEVQLRLSAHLREQQFAVALEGELQDTALELSGQRVILGTQPLRLQVGGRLHNRHLRIEAGEVALPDLGEIRLQAPLEIGAHPLSSLALGFQLYDLQALQPFLVSSLPSLHLAGRGEGKVRVQVQEDKPEIAVEVRFSRLLSRWRRYRFAWKELAVEVTTQAWESGLLPLSGKIVGELAQGKTILLTFRLLYAATGNRWRLSPLQVSFPPYGQLILRGELRQPFGRRGAIDLSYRLKTLSLAQGVQLLQQVAPLPPLSVAEGEVTTKGRIRGSWPRLSIQGEGAVRDVLVTVKEKRLLVSAATLRYRLHYPQVRVTIRSLRGTVGEPVEAGLALPGAQRSAVPSPPAFRLQGEGEIDLSTLAYTVQQGKLQFGEQEEWAFSLQGTLSSPQVHTFTLHTDRLEGEELWQRVAPLWLSNFRDWTINGTVTLQSEGRIAETLQGLTYTLQTVVEVHQGGFQSPDGTKAMANLETRVTLVAEGGSSIPAVTFRVSGALGNCEVLWGEFGEMYGNFAGKFLQFAGKGEYEPGATPFLRLQGEGNFTPADRVVFSGNLTALVPRLQGDLSLQVDLPLDTFYTDYLLQPLQETFPFLQNLRVQGKGGLNLQVQGTGEHFRLRGTLQVHEGRIDWMTHQVTMAGVEMQLPFTLRYPSPSTPPVPQPSDYGTLTIQALTFSSLHFSDLSLAIAVVENRLSLRDPLRLPLWGGEIRMTGVQIPDVLHPQPQLLASLTLQQIDLEQLTSLYGPVTIQGKLEGVLSRLLFQGDRWQAEGEIVLQVFGGEIKLLDITGENLFSPIPTLRLTLLGRGLDLAQLTPTFNLGLITGSLNIYVDELEIVSGEPQRFDAVIETVPRPGQKQQISIDAIEQITTLEGGPSGLLDSSIYRFFQHYNYEKIGIWARLRTDTFFLRGLVHRGERELFLKGRGIPRLDIVNHAPPQGISFKEMVQRLRRIGVAMGAEKGPEVQEP